jgi:hypothetical protein
MDSSSSQKSGSDVSGQRNLGRTPFSKLYGGSQQSSDDGTGDNVSEINLTTGVARPLGRLTEVTVDGESEDESRPPSSASHESPPGLFRHAIAGSSTAGSGDRSDTSCDSDTAV